MIGREEAQKAVNAFVIAAKRINYNPKDEEKKDILAAIMAAGKNFPAWEASIEKHRDSMQKSNRKFANIHEIIDHYRDICESTSRVECEKCKKSGWVSVILLFGKFEDYLRVYVYDPNRLNREKTYRAVWKLQLEAEHRFMPCSCKNGDLRNKKHGGEWLEPKFRRLIESRHFKENGDKDYWIEEHLRMLNCFRLGKPYQVRNPQEYSVSDYVKQLQTVAQKIG